MMDGYGRTRSQVGLYVTEFLETFDALDGWGNTNRAQYLRGQGSNAVNFWHWALYQVVVWTKTITEKKGIPSQIMLHKRLYLWLDASWLRYEECYSSFSTFMWYKSYLSTMRILVSFLNTTYFAIFTSLALIILFSLLVVTKQNTNFITLFLWFIQRLLQKHNWNILFIYSPIEIPKTCTILPDF